MSIFRSRHDWGEVIPTIPATQVCSRCGIHRQVGDGNIDDLPIDMRFTILPESRECQKNEFTRFQIEEATRSGFQNGFTDGQNKGIHLQDNFTKEFIKRATLNPATKCYEIPEESYQILKDKFIGAVDE